jgi:GT2 family glycosyltransferase
VLTVDVIVVNHQTRDLLRACLCSLRHAGRRLRVIVVDNASSDGSAEMVREEFPEAGVLRLGRNIGFARANNAAYDLVTADAVLLLNSDAELTAGALEALAGALESEPDVAAAGPVLVGADGRVQFEGGRRDPSILGELGNISHLNTRLPRSVLGRYLMNDWDHRSSRDVEVLCGACMLVRRAALGERLFDEDFFMYGEDVELCQRLRDGGWRLRYVGEARVTHHGGATSRKARTRMRVAGVVSMAQLLRRRRGAAYAAGYLAAVPLAWPLGVLVRKAWPL